MLTLASQRGLVRGPGGGVGGHGCRGACKRQGGGGWGRSHQGVHGDPCADGPPAEDAWGDVQGEIVLPQAQLAVTRLHRGQRGQGRGRGGALLGDAAAH